MNLKSRLRRLEKAVAGVSKHACGPIDLVDGGEDFPILPDCAECDRTGRIRYIHFADLPSEASDEDSADSRPA